MLGGAGRAQTNIDGIMSYPTVCSNCFSASPHEAICTAHSWETPIYNQGDNEKWE